MLRIPKLMFWLLYIRRSLRDGQYVLDFQSKTRGLKLLHTTYCIIQLFHPIFIVVFFDRRDGGAGPSPARNVLNYEFATKLLIACYEHHKNSAGIRQP